MKIYVVFIEKEMILRLQNPKVDPQVFEIFHHRSTISNLFNTTKRPKQNLFYTYRFL